MQTIQKILFIVLIPLFHTIPAATAPTSLETSLMLLKAKLLSLARALSPQKPDIVPWELSKQEKKAKPIKAYEAHYPEKDYIKALEKILQAGLKKNNKKKLNAADLLGAFLAGRNYKEQIEFLLNNYPNEIIQEALPGQLEEIINEREIEIITKGKPDEQDQKSLKMQEYVRADTNPKLIPLLQELSKKICHKDNQDQNTKNQLIEKILLIISKIQTTPESDIRDDLARLIASMPQLAEYPDINKTIEIIKNVSASNIDKDKKITITPTNKRYIPIRQDTRVEDNEWELVPEILEPKPLDENTVRVKTAKKWIRNAAVRIFNDPLRSFLELVVNGVDATVEKYWGPEHSVGKFGMGFFSILALLWWRQEGWDVGNYGTTITVTTAARKKPESPITVYRLSFDKVPDAQHPNDPNYDDIQITITTLSSTENQDEYKAFWKKILLLAPTVKKTQLRESLNPKTLPTGTIVSIQPKNGNVFSEKTLNIVENYIHYMDLYPYVDIELKKNNGQKSIGKKLTPAEKIAGKIPDMPHIQATLNENIMEVVDAGTGMTLGTLLFKLLIPSVSTKRKEKGAEGLEKKDTLTTMRETALAEPAKSPELITFTGKPDPTKSHFLITVNGVIVVNRVLQQPIKDKYGKIQDLVVHMPQATQLTLARNELSIGEADDNFEKKYLEKIVDETIKSIVSGKNKENGPLLLALFRGLKDWENQSAAHHIKGHFSGHLKQTLKSVMNGQEGKNFIPMPEFFAKQNAQLTENIFEKDKSIQVMLDSELVDYNFSKFEEYIQTVYRKKAGSIKVKNIHDIVTDGLDGKLIAGFKVCFVPDTLLPQGKNADGKDYPILSSLGTRATLFVPESFLDLNDRQKIVDAITSICTFQKIHGLEKGNEGKNDFIITTNATEKLNFSFYVPDQKEYLDKNALTFIENNKTITPKTQDTICNYCLEYMNNGNYWYKILKGDLFEKNFFYTNKMIENYSRPIGSTNILFLFNKDKKDFLGICIERNYSQINSWDELEKAASKNSIGLTFKELKDKEKNITVKEAINKVLENFKKNHEEFKNLIGKLPPESPWVKELTENLYINRGSYYPVKEFVPLLFYALFKHFNFLDNNGNLKKDIFFYQYCGQFL